MNKLSLKYIIFNIVTLMMIFSIGSCNKKASLKFEVKGVNENKSSVRPKIPGPRTCFWSTGPASKDPYVNVAYPDAGVFYWHAMFSVPEGAQLHLEGEFPHSRYMSLISYDERGAPVESLSDYLIIPNDGDGALDEDVTVVQIRNMLASSNFPHAIQNVTEIGKEKEIMGPYLPKSNYMMTNMFEV